MDRAASGPQRGEALEEELIVRIELLGGFRVFQADRPLPTKAWRTDKAKAVLALLATQPGRVLQRDWLARTLWPEVDLERAAINLRGRIVEARRALEPDLRHGRRSRYILSRAGGYCLRAEVEVDLLAFQAALRRGLRALRRERWSQALQDLQRAIDLYQDGFLPEFSREAWAHPWQERCRQEALRARVGLAQAHQALNRYDRALVHWQEAVTLAPAHEPAVKGLVRCHLTLGQRAEALAACRAGVAALEALELEPDAELLELEDQARRSAVPRQQRPFTGRVRWPTALARPPFVGRRAAWEQLARAQAFAARRAAAAAVLGEPGIGKTRLIETFLEHLCGSARVLRGYGLWQDERIPHRALAQLVDPLLRRLPAARFEGLSPPARAQLAALCPALTPPAREEPVPRSPADLKGRLALIEGLAAAFDVHEEGPLALWLDDLQWVDPPSLEILGELGRRLHDRPVLWLFSGDRAAAPRLRRWAHAAQLEAHCSWIELGPLAAEEVEQLLGKLSQGSCPAEVLALLCRQSAGHPLHLIALLFSLFEAGRLALDEQGRWQLQGSLENLSLSAPAAVQAGLERQLAALHPTCVRALSAAAVLGGSFTPRVLAKTLGLSSSELLSALDVLLQHHLLEEEGGHLRFAYPLLQKAVYERLSASCRRRLHRRAAEALDGPGGQALLPTRQALLVHHYERAQAWTHAYRWARRALDNALRCYQLDEAQRWHERAAALLDRRPLEGRKRQRARIDLELERVKLDELKGDPIAQRRTLERALRLAEALEDPGAQAQVHERLAWLAALKGDDTGALERAHRARQHWSQCPEHARYPQGLDQLGGLYWHLGYYAQALACYRQAQRVFSERGQTREAALALDNVGIAARNLGRLGQACEAHLQALAIFERLQDTFGQGVSCNNLACWHAWVGQSRQARLWARQAFRLHRTLGNERGCGFAYQNLAQVYAWEGRRRHADRLLQRAWSLYERIGERARLAVLALRRGRLVLSAGSPRCALARFEDAEARARALSCADVAAVARAAQSLALLALGRPQEALARYASVLVAYRNGVRPVPFWLHWCHARVLHANEAPPERVQAALRRARGALLRWARALPEPQRHTFLAAPLHRRLIALDARPLEEEGCLDTHL